VYRIRDTEKIVLTFCGILGSRDETSKMADISKADLKKEIQDILKDADLDNTSAKKVAFLF
jgi:hypothetical protein